MTRKGPMRVPYSGAPRVPRYHLTPSGWVVVAILVMWTLVALGWVALLRGVL